MKVSPLPPQNPLLRLSAAALLAALLTLPLGATAYAQSSIRVLVNDEPITSFDIKARARMLTVFSGGRQGEKDAIEQLIDERLMLQEAKRRHVTISDQEVEAEVANRARGAKLDASRFAAAMQQAGIPPETFKAFLRANLAWSQVVKARFRATVDITDTDVAAALTKREAKPEAATTATEYRLQQIVFVVPGGAATGLEAQRRKEAEAFRSSFQGCDQAITQAAGKPSIVVKPQVRREEGQLAPPMRQALSALEVGGTTPPERVPEGVQIVAVCAKNAIAGQTEETVQVREEISNERGRLLARRYLRDLRSDAVIEYR